MNDGDPSARIGRFVTGTRTTSIGEDAAAPRRERADLLTPAEVAIDSAIALVGRSVPRPDMAVVFLQLARRLVSDHVDGRIYADRPLPAPRWPREVVVEHDDGTVSLMQDVVEVDFGRVRARRANDVVRAADEREPECDCQSPPGKVKDFAAISVDCPIHGDDA